MKSKTQFVVLEWYNGNLEDFIKFEAEEAVGAYQMSLKYIKQLEQRCEEMNTTCIVRKGVMPDGSFSIKLETDTETYELDGYFDDQVIC